MKEIEIKSVDDIHKQLQNYRSSTSYIFRGQSDSAWELIPKAGRSPYTNVSDYGSFRHWKRRAVAYLGNEFTTDWELLAIAQHTGLPTRLLDWTLNPLAAVFFAAADNFETNGAVFVYKIDKRVKHETVQPFDLKKRIATYQPNASSHRIVNQLGYFTVHGDPTIALNDKTKDGVLEKLIITSCIKKDLTFMLNQYGVNYLTLFPDLDGLSKHLSWFIENYNFWGKTFDDKLLQNKAELD